VKRIVGACVLAVLALATWLAFREPASPPPIHETATPSDAPSRPAIEPLAAGDDRTQIAARPATPAAEVRPSAGEASSDPTEAELERFARTCPAGTIEGVVLLGAVPVSGGRAWLAGEVDGGLPWGSPAIWDAAGTVNRTSIDADGVFRFEGLRPDTYGVGVETTDGRTRHVFCTLREGESSTQRIRIVLGTGGVRGHVFDERGSACPGWQVAVNTWGPGIAGTQIIDSTETDRAGAFAFPGLLGARYMLTAWRGAEATRGERLTASFDLPPTTWKTVDLGAAHGRALWTGRILLPRGEPLALLPLVELEIESTGVRERTVVSPSSSFEARIAPGLHRLGLCVANKGVVPIGELTTTEHDLVHDVTVPAAIVRIRAKYQGNRRASEEVLRLYSVRLAATPSGSILEGEHGEGGLRYFLALPPGVYALRSTTDAILGAVGGSLPVHIGAADDEVDVDVALGDP
jgi:hypothetical protein